MAALALERAPAPALAWPRELEPAPAPALAWPRELERAPAPAPAPVSVSAPARPQGGIDVDVLALLRLRDQMKKQLMEYSAAVHCGQESDLDHVTEEKCIQSATQDLQRAIEEVKVSFQSKTLALQRIQMMDVLRNKVNPDGDEDSRLILETMKHIGLLSQTIIESQQQAHKKKQQLIDIKRKRLSLKQDGGQKLQQIQNMMKRKQEQQASVNVAEREKMLSKLEKDRELTTIIQNVFQNIIIGSRINWAEDPSLKEIVLHLEKNVYLQ